MPEAVIAIAVAEVKPGKEAEFEGLARELFALMRRKGYGTDRLVRSLHRPHLYYDIRDWSSLEAAEEAHRDPEIHRFWARLDGVCKITEVVTAREVKL